MSQTADLLARVGQQRRARTAYAEVLRIFTKSPPAAAGAVVVGVVILLSLLANWVAPYDPLDKNIALRLAGPNLAHPFGTDDIGRDVLSRVIWGSRISLYVGVVAVAASLVVGMALGAVAGYFGGLIDNLLMRFIDMLLAFPGLLLAIIIVASLGPGLENCLIAISISMLPNFARLVRGSTLTVRELDYVAAAVALGASPLRIIARHVVPNILGPVVVFATLRVAGAILIEATLSFMGLGVRPPTPTWGSVVAEGRQYLLSAPWISTFGGLVMMFTVTSLNLLGDALRDALDPRLRGETS